METIQELTETETVAEVPPQSVSLPPPPPDRDEMERRFNECAELTIATVMATFDLFLAEAAHAVNAVSAENARLRALLKSVQRSKPN